MVLKTVLKPNRF